MGQIVRHTPSTIRDMLAKMKGEIANAAPRHLTPDRIMRIFMTSVQRNPKLYDCTGESLMGCLLTCTQLGLEVDSVSQKAHLIPYKVKGVPTCTLVVGYKGLMELARRSDDVLDLLPPQEVREKDTFDYELGQSPKLTHKPADGDRGDVTHYYSVAVLKSGERSFHVMTKGDVDKIRDEQLAKAYDSKTSPWTLHETAMGLKTVIRHFAKWLPSASELQTAIGLDERAEAGITQGIDHFVDVDGTSTPTEEPSLADKIKAKKQPEPTVAAKPAAAVSTEDATTAAASVPADDGEVLALRKQINAAARSWGSTAKALGILQKHGIKSVLALGKCEEVETLNKILGDITAAMDA